MKIEDQIHFFEDNGNSKEIRLWDIFKEYSQTYRTNITQLIRLPASIYTPTIEQLSFCSLALFNKADSVNNWLIDDYQQEKKSAALLVRIHWYEAIIDAASVKIVDVLEMKNISYNEINQQDLYHRSLAQTSNAKQLYEWLGDELYKWEKISTQEELLYRKIKLIHSS